MFDILFVYSHIYVLCFFFFKQKTAYELRISDWSSDVCSSDLTAAIHRCNYEPLAKGIGLRVCTLDQKGNVLAIWRHGKRACRGVGVGPKIGRASCRERVCQYV